MIEVSVVIPTFNGLKLLKTSVPKLLSSLKNINNEIILVDNASTDETEEFIKGTYPKIRLVKLDKNYGFTRAVNEGAKKSKGKYILILNNDCFLEKDTVKKLVSKLENSKLVATQPVVYKRDKKTIENIGYIIDTHVGKAKVLNEININSVSLSSRYIYGLSGVCLLIDKMIFGKIGMLDKSFHSYLEDVDLFIRLAKKGYQYGPTIDAKCVHYHMSTSTRMGVYKQKHDFVNWIRIIVKNFSFTFILRHLPTLFIERLRNLNGIIKKML